MKNLLRHLDDWRARLQGRSLALLLDYDGTLSAIAPTPALARLPLETKEILTGLVRSKGVKIAIISGRAWRDLREMVSIRGVSYIGSHGIEYLKPGLSVERVSKGYLSGLEELKKKYMVTLSRLPGVLLEEKPFSLAIHYRLTSPAVEAKVKKAVLGRSSSAVWEQQALILRGKKVLEVMPHCVTNKGRAALRLLKEWGEDFIPIFVGDDLTDEVAFNALRGRGLTVKVGDAGVWSEAEYYLASVDAVRQFLKMILDTRLSRNSLLAAHALNSASQ